MRGAFDGLDRIIERRSSSRSGIGFRAEVRGENEKKKIGEVLLDVEPEDLVGYGLIPEFVGRMPIVATLQELDESQLIRILTEPKNALTKQYERMFDMESTAIEFRDEALRAVARRAMERKTGARGLRSILEGCLLDTMYELPSMEDVAKVVVDEGVVSGDTPPLMIYEGDVKQVASE